MNDAEPGFLGNVLHKMGIHSNPQGVAIEDSLPAQTQELPPRRPYQREGIIHVDPPRLDLKSAIEASPYQAADPIPTTKDARPSTFYGRVMAGESFGIAPPSSARLEQPNSPTKETQFSPDQIQANGINILKKAGISGRYFDNYGELEESTKKILSRLAKTIKVDAALQPKYQQALDYLGAALIISKMPDPYKPQIDPAYMNVPRGFEQNLDKTKLNLGLIGVEMINEQIRHGNPQESLSNLPNVIEVDKATQVRYIDRDQANLNIDPPSWSEQMLALAVGNSGIAFDLSTHKPLANTEVLSRSDLSIMDILNRIANTTTPQGQFISSYSRP